MVFTAARVYTTTSLYGYQAHYHHQGLYDHQTPALITSETISSMSANTTALIPQNATKSSIKTVETSMIIMQGVSAPSIETTMTTSIAESTAVSASMTASSSPLALTLTRLIPQNEAMSSVTTMMNSVRKVIINSCTTYL
uniref:Uncharacterized protein n=1 Tax=Romanomermis culicivorax TaxID=13658 RepID=A0A915JH40_ROMCU